MVGTLKSSEPGAAANIRWLTVFSFQRRHYNYHYLFPASTATVQSSMGVFWTALVGFTDGFTFHSARRNGRPLFWAGLHKVYVGAIHETELVSIYYHLLHRGRSGGEEDDTNIDTGYYYNYYNY